MSENSPTKVVWSSPTRKVLKNLSPTQNIINTNFSLDKEESKVSSVFHTAENTPTKSCTIDDYQYVSRRSRIKISSTPSSLEESDLNLSVYNSPVSTENKQSMDHIIRLFKKLNVNSPVNSKETTSDIEPTQNRLFDQIDANSTSNSNFYDALDIRELEISSLDSESISSRNKFKDSLENLPINAENESNFDSIKSLTFSDFTEKNDNQFYEARDADVESEFDSLNKNTLPSFEEVFKIPEQVQQSKLLNKNNYSISNDENYDITKNDKYSDIFLENKAVSSTISQPSTSIKSTDSTFSLDSLNEENVNKRSRVIQEQLSELNFDRDLEEFLIDNKLSLENSIDSKLEITNAVCPLHSDEKSVNTNENPSILSELISDKDMEEFLMNEEQIDTEWKEFNDSELFRDQFAILEEPVSNEVVENIKKIDILDQIYFESSSDKKILVNKSCEDVLPHNLNNTSIVNHVNFNTTINQNELDDKFDINVQNILLNSSNIEKTELNTKFDSIHNSELVLEETFTGKTEDVAVENIDFKESIKRNETFDTQTISEINVEELAQPENQIVESQERSALDEIFESKNSTLNSCELIESTNTLDILTSPENNNLITEITTAQKESINSIESVPIVQNDESYLDNSESQNNQTLVLTPESNLNTFNSREDYSANKTLMLDAASHNTEEMFNKNVDLTVDMVKITTRNENNTMGTLEVIKSNDDIKNNLISVPREHLDCSVETATTFIQIDNNKIENMDIIKSSENCLSTASQNILNSTVEIAPVFNENINNITRNLQISNSSENLENHASTKEIVICTTETVAVSNESVKNFTAETVSVSNDHVNTIKETLQSVKSSENFENKLSISDKILDTPVQTLSISTENVNKIIGNNEIVNSSEINEVCVVNNTSTGQSFDSTVETISISNENNITDSIETMKPWENLEDTEITDEILNSVAETAAVSTDANTIMEIVESRQNFENKASSDDEISNSTVETVSVCNENTNNKIENIENIKLNEYLENVLSAVRQDASIVETIPVSNENINNIRNIEIVNSIENNVTTGVVLDSSVETFSTSNKENMEITSSENLANTENDVIFDTTVETVSDSKENINNTIDNIVKSGENPENNASILENVNNIIENVKLKENLESNEIVPTEPKSCVEIFDSTLETISVFNESIDNKLENIEIINSKDSLESYLIPTAQDIVDSTVETAPVCNEGINYTIGNNTQITNYEENLIVSHVSSSNVQVIDLIKEPEVNSTPILDNNNKNPIKNLDSSIVNETIQINEKTFDTTLVLSNENSVDLQTPDGYVTREIFDQSDLEHIGKSAPLNQIDFTLVEASKDIGITNEVKNTEMEEHHMDIVEENKNKEFPSPINSTIEILNNSTNILPSESEDHLDKTSTVDLGMKSISLSIDEISSRMEKMSSNTFEILEQFKNNQTLVLNSTTENESPITDLNSTNSDKKFEVIDIPKSDKTDVVQICTSFELSMNSLTDITEKDHLQPPIKPEDENDIKSIEDNNLKILDDKMDCLNISSASSELSKTLVGKNDDEMAGSEESNCSKTSSTVRVSKMQTLEANKSSSESKLEIPNKSEQNIQLLNSTINLKDDQLFQSGIITNCNLDTTFDNNHRNVMDKTINLNLENAENSVLDTNSPMSNPILLENVNQTSSIDITNLKASKTMDSPDNFYSGQSVILSTLNQSEISPSSYLDVFESSVTKFNLVEIHGKAIKSSRSDEKIIVEAKSRNEELNLSSNINEEKLVNEATNFKNIDDITKQVSSIEPILHKDDEVEKLSVQNITIEQIVTNLQNTANNNIDTLSKHDILNTNDESLIQTNLESKKCIDKSEVTETLNNSSSAKPNVASSEEHFVSPKGFSWGSLFGKSSNTLNEGNTFREPRLSVLTIFDPLLNNSPNKSSNKNTNSNLISSQKHELDNTNNNPSTSNLTSVANKKSAIVQCDKPQMMEQNILLQTNESNIQNEISSQNELNNKMLIEINKNPSTPLKLVDPSTEIKQLTTVLKTEPDEGFSTPVKLVDPSTEFKQLSTVLKTESGEGSSTPVKLVDPFTEIKQLTTVLDMEPEENPSKLVTVVTPFIEIKQLTAVLNTEPDEIPSTSGKLNAPSTIPKQSSTVLKNDIKKKLFKLQERIAQFSKTADTSERGKLIAEYRKEILQLQKIYNESNNNSLPQYRAKETSSINYTDQKKLNQLETNAKYLLEEKHKLQNEKLVARNHLMRCEDALDDVRQKFETMKERIMEYQKSEKEMLSVIDNQIIKADELNEKYSLLKQQAIQDLSKCNENYAKLTHDNETKSLALEVQLRREKLRHQRLENELKSEIEERNRLSEMCDDILMNRK